MTQFTFQQTPFLPIVVGFFGLGTGYLIWGGQALFGFPKANEETNKTMGMWGLWMPGFMQFLTGVILLVGLTWFNVFGEEKPLYMAALAFTAFGIHWFALAHRRFIGSDERPDAWMAIAFFLLSLLGAIVFFGVGDVPTGILFVGLMLVYITEIPTRFGVFASGPRLVGLWQFLTGLWLMYLTFGVTLETVLGVNILVS
jgi:hypothetical protein